MYEHLVKGYREPSLSREEAIHILNNLKPTNTKSQFEPYDVGKAITKAIKALEQEPVLDKIRAEIERVYEQSSYIHEGEDWRDGLMIAERIIDKYREGE